MQSVQESLNPWGPLLPDEMIYLYCITAGRICFCQEIIDSFLMYRCLLSAEWHTASTVRHSGQHLYRTPPCAARGRSGVWTCRSLVLFFMSSHWMTNCVKLFFEFVSMSRIDTGISWNPTHFGLCFHGFSAGAQQTPASKLKTELWATAIDIACQESKLNICDGRQ